MARVAFSVIKVYPATQEVRERDEKRRRVILEIGGSKLHLSQEEAWELSAQLGQVLSGLSTE